MSVEVYRLRQYEDKTLCCLISKNIREMDEFLTSHPEFEVSTCSQCLLDRPYFCIAFLKEKGNTEKQPVFEVTLRMSLSTGTCEIESVKAARAELVSVLDAFIQQLLDEDPDDAFIEIRRIS